MLLHYVPVLVIQHLEWASSLFMSASWFFKSVTQRKAHKDKWEIWFSRKRGNLCERENVKPFISVFILGLVITVAWPLLAKHWALKLGGGSWCQQGLEWLLVGSLGVINSFAVLIIAIFGAIKSSISPLMAFTPCHIHDFYIHHRLERVGRKEGKIGGFCEG